MKNAHPEFICQTISLRSVSAQLNCVVLPVKYLLLNRAKLKEKLGVG